METEEELNKIQEELKDRETTYVLLLWMIVSDELKKRMKDNKTKKKK